MDPRIGCCIDVGHAARAGTDVVKAIHEVGPRLFNVHMKDLARLNEQREPGGGGRGHLAGAGNLRGSDRRPSTKASWIWNMKFILTIRCLESSAALLTCAAFSQGWVIRITPNVEPAGGTVLSS